jgi:hypothetical protein
VAAVKALRGVDLISAVTIMAGIGDPRRCDAIGSGNRVGCSPFRAPQAMQLLIVIESAPTGSCYLQTGSEIRH